MSKTIDTIFFATLTIIAFVLIVVYFVRLYKKLTKNNTKNKKPYQEHVPVYQQIEPQEPIHEPITNTNNLPYRKKFLLTKNEWAFYKSLKPVADELGYTVLAKIRVADIVEVTAKDRSEWQKYFNKINSKHVDFILAKPENLQIILLIELDDNTHNEAQKQRDSFIDELYKQAGYKLLRTRGNGELKAKITTALGIKPTAPPSV